MQTRQFTQAWAQAPDSPHRPTTRQQVQVMYSVRSGRKTDQHHKLGCIKARWLSPTHCTAIPASWLTYKEEVKPFTNPSTSQISTHCQEPAFPPQQMDKLSFLKPKYYQTMEKKDSLRLNWFWFYGIKCSLLQSPLLLDLNVAWKSAYFLLSWMDLYTICALSLSFCIAVEQL